MQLVVASPLSAQPNFDVDYSGEWATDFGPVVMVQEGTSVTGTYSYGLGGTLSGEVDGARLTFVYLEPAATGTGYFELADTDRFDGRWQQDGDGGEGVWRGTRTRPVETRVIPLPLASSSPLAGLFETSWGRVRLVQTSETDFRGFYSGGGGLEGSLNGDRLEFTWEQEGATGTGWFSVRIDGISLDGGWTSEAGASGEWGGHRVLPQPGVRWLVVLEAQWELSLAENEYSFGDMLRTYFERLPDIRVRHRRIADRSDYLRAGEELMFLAEPTYLWLSGHGVDGRLSVPGGGVGETDVLETLRSAQNVVLAHFSSCEMMVGGAPERIRAALPAERDLVLSGYAVPVDWGGSAVFEILYLDLLLGREMRPAEAQRVLESELNFADDGATAGSPLGALHFRLVE